MSSSLMSENVLPKFRQFLRGGLNLNVLDLPNFDDNDSGPRRLTRRCADSQGVSYLRKALNETSTPIPITGKLSPSIIEVERQKMEEAYFGEVCERSTWDMFEIVSRSR
jgi:hypothetical protein